MKNIRYTILLLTFFVAFSSISIAQQKQEDKPLKSNVESTPKVYFKANTNNDKFVSADVPKRKNKNKDEDKNKKSDKITESVDSVIIDVIGKERNKLLANLPIIEAYELESFAYRDTTNKIPILEEFKILRTNQLTKSQAQHIFNLLKDKDTYVKHNKYKQCLFLPQMGLKLADTTGQQMNILFSYECNMIRFYVDGEYKILNSDTGYDALFAFYEEVFPPKEEAKAEKIVKAPIFYTVERKDNLTVIAKKASNTYKKKITVEDLKKWNELTSTTIFPKDRLIVNYKD